MNKKYINLTNHYLHILILFTISFFVSYSYTFLQYGVDGGLVLANQIKYPDFNSPMLFYYLNSWTSIHQFSYLLINLGFSVEFVSKVLILISTCFFSFGVFFFSFSITQKKNLSLLIAVTAILLGKNFGDTDYPSLIFSEHSYGMISLALVTFSFGLFANKNYFFGSALLIFLISVHPCVGLWMILMVIISFFFFNTNKLQNIEIVKGISLGFFFLLISFIFFYINSLDKIDYDSSLFINYLDNWDGHRAVTKLVHYEYIFKTIILCLLTFIFLKKNNNLKSNNNIHLLILLISMIASTVIYIAFKIIPNFFPQFITIAMPSRFIMLHTFLGWPLIISYIFYFLENRFNKKNVLKIFLIILSLTLLQNYKKIHNIKNNIVLNLKVKEPSKVLEYVKKNNFDGYVLTSSKFASIVFKKSKKPILLHTDSMDFIPYHPYLIDKFFDILISVYKINNYEPPEQNNPSLPDEYVKKIFEIHKEKDWRKFKNLFNIKFVITPKNWDLDLNLVLEDEIYNLYKIL